jgi:hypothetical protein
MIDYKRLCNNFIEHPTFSNAKHANVLLAMIRAETLLYKEDKETALIADNEKWYRLWMEMKIAVCDGPYMWGCKQFTSQMIPLRDSIIGKYQR